MMMMMGAFCAVLAIFSGEARLRTQGYVLRRPTKSEGNARSHKSYAAVAWNVLRHAFALGALPEMYPHTNGIVVVYS